MNTGATIDDDRNSGQDQPGEDRLPWLESAEVEEQEGPSVARVVALVLLGLALVAAAIFAFNTLRKPGSGAAVADGQGGLIKAAPGDYKTKPDEPGGMKVDGEGDTVFATSDGSGKNGAVDVTRVPEAPIAGKAAPKAAAPDKGTAKVVTAVPASGGAITAKAPLAAPRAAANAGGGGSIVQLGSFPSEGGANGAWATLSKRFAYVAALGKSVEKADVNGSTVYRLRVNAGSAGNATTLCGKLKVAGENCFIPK